MRCNITANVPLEGEHEDVQLDVEYGSQSSVCVYEKVIKSLPCPMFHNKFATDTEHSMPAGDERRGYSRHPLPTGPWR